MPPQHHAASLCAARRAAAARRDVRRLKRGRYDILAIETRHLDQGELTEIIWQRDDGPDAITAAELPF